MTLSKIEGFVVKIKTVTRKVTATKTLTTSGIKELQLWAEI